MEEWGSKTPYVRVGALQQWLEHMRRTFALIDVPWECSEIQWSLVHVGTDRRRDRLNESLDYTE